MNKECEHEWVDSTPYGFICKKCGRNQLSNPNDTVNFKISEKPYIPIGFSKDYQKGYKDGQSDQVCKFCGKEKSAINTPIFHCVEENLSEINKQQWEDIWKEWNDYVEYAEREDWEFYTWFKENYFSPEKKNT